MEVVPTSLDGCIEIRHDVFRDDRGYLVNLHQTSTMAGLGLRTTFVQTLLSVSSRGVLRGLHFQVPPTTQAKLVNCVDGSILDAVVDLRVGSPTFGQYALVELSAEKSNALFVPAGFAHGFYVSSPRAVVVYLTSAEYSPAHDGGIHWDSLGIPWPDHRPRLSEKDARLPPFAAFESPFRYGKT